MTTQIQRRRGTDTQHGSFTGAEGELSVNTTNKSVHVHDGATAGGFEAARADLGNVSDADLNSALTGNTLSSLTITSADINGGTIDGTVIGGSTAAAGSFTTLSASTSITGTLATAAQTNITSVGTLTSLDVAGSVTADGLTVEAASPTLILKDSDSTGAPASGLIRFNESDNSTSAQIGFGSTSNSDFDIFQFENAAIDVWTNATPRMSIEGNGDISFYEDTGTTPKFFWDASAESLGIGTSSPSSALTVQSDSGALFSDAVGSRFIEIVPPQTANSFVGEIGTRSSHPLVFNTVGSERMRIDSSGNVGIGTSSPDRLLHLSSNAAIVCIEDTGGATNDKRVQLQVDSGQFEINSRNDDNSSRVDNIFVADLGTGNVGIGTNSPSSPLHLYGNNTSLVLQDDQSDALRLSAGSAGSYIQSGSSLTSGATNPLIFGSIFAADEWMRIDSSGNVGIGASSPNAKLDVAGTLNVTGNCVLGDVSTDVTTIKGRLQVIAGTVASCGIRGVGDPNTGFLIGATADTVQVVTGGSEAMRIDSSGNLLVGKTANNTLGTAGANISADGWVQLTATSRPLMLNRLNSDGNILEFFKDGSTVGSIGTFNGSLHIGSGSDFVRTTSNSLRPCDSGGSNRDNVMDVGSTSARFDDIYATNGTIQTSDRNEKQDIEALSDAEQRVAVTCKGLLRKFRWKDAVAEKGDDARIHFGIIAQDLQDAFAAEGLDAGRYAMFISTTWTDEETGEERTRMGVRYSELLAFIIAAI